MTYIKFRYEDEPYILEFNRSTAEDLYKRGFRIDECRDTGTLVQFPMLFRGALKMHHPKIKPAMEQKLLKATRSLDLWKKLLAMYTEVMENTIFEADEEEAKKVIWETDLTAEEDDLPEY